MRTFYKQVLTGDRVDNIPGLKGIGDKKAEKILGEAKTEQDLFTAVLAAYDDDILRMTEMAQLLWIRRKEGEMWTPPKL
jgi:5'-3' exonuclease